MSGTRGATGGVPGSSASLVSAAPIHPGTIGQGSGGQGQGDAQSQAPRQDGTIHGLYTSSHALVIGNDAYEGGNKGWPKLGKAVADARAVKQALEHHGFKVTFLQDLRSDQFKQEMKRFFIRNGAQKDSRLFVWFAGHGHTVQAEGYLVPVDAPHPNNDADFREKAVSMREVAGWMREARSKHILAVFDSCFSGTIFRASRSLQAPTAAIMQYAQHPIRQILTSGSATQEVQDDGYFQQLFVRTIMGLEPKADQTGDGFVTGQELATFMRARVTEQNGHRQSPQFGEITDNDTERGDFIFQVSAQPNAGGTPQLASVQGDASQRAAPRPGLPNFNAKRIYIEPVMGATGDGNAALREALRARLGKEGIEVWDQDSEGAFKLQAVVTVRNAALLVDEVTIEWRLLNKSRGQITTFKQVSEVLSGSRNKEWGAAAEASADYAAKKVVKFLATN